MKIILVELILLVVMSITFGGMVGYYYIPQPPHEASSCGYEFINSQNIRAFCESQAFDGGWNGCSQGGGFTCFRVVGEFSQYHCFGYEELAR